MICDWCDEEATARVLKWGSEHGRDAGAIYLHACGDHTDNLHLSLTKLKQKRPPASDLEQSPLFDPSRFDRERQ